MTRSLVHFCLGYALMMMLWTQGSELVIYWLMPTHSAPDFWPFLKGFISTAFSTIVFYSAGLLLLQKLKQNRDQLNETRNLLRQAVTVYDHTHEGVLLADSQQKIVHVNAAFEHITGYTLEEVAGRTPSLLASGLHDSSFYREMWSSIKSQGSWAGEIWNRRKDGETYPQWQNLREIRDDSGEITHYIAIFSDLSKLRQSQDKLNYLANYDPLVDLPNRLLFRERAQQVLERAQHTGESGALLLIDIDHFKRINESLGHDVGDKLLRKIAQRLQKHTNNMTLSRTAGDEYCILYEHCSADQAATLALLLLESLRLPFLINEQPYFISASIGISCFPSDTDNAEELLRNANSALTRAKDQGRDTYAFYSHDLTESALQRLTWITRLRQGLELEHLRIFYQPIQQLSNNSRIAYEALVRWDDPVKGLISPQLFIPLAEESGLIQKIDIWVLDQACSQMRRWLDLNTPIQYISVNLSSRLFSQASLLESIETLLIKHRLPPQHIQLEVTESAVMQNPELSIQILDQLREKGLRIAIDDFGTGYSSLQRLQRLGAHTLKLDQAFIQGLPDNQENAAITRAVISLGHNLGMTVLAEGVETTEQAEFLLHNGCDLAQGYGFGKPAPYNAKRFIPVLRYAQRFNFPQTTVKGSSHCSFYEKKSPKK